MRTEEANAMNVANGISPERVQGPVTRMRHVVIRRKANSLVGEYHFGLLLLMAVAIVIGGIVGWFGIGFVLFLTIMQDTDEPAGWCYLCMGIGSLVGAYLGIHLVIQALYRWRIYELLLRVERLHSLALHPRFQEKLPHRALERLLLSRNPTKSCLRRFIASLPPGVTIGVNVPRPYPVRRSVAFEPVPLKENEQSLKELVTFNLEQQATNSNQRATTDESLNCEAVTFRKKGADLVAACMVIALISLTSLFQRGAQIGVPIGANVAFIVVSCALIIVITLGRQVIHRQWWIVPGGLIYRKIRSWRQRSKVGMTTPQDSPLLIHHGERGFGMLVEKGRTIEFECPGAVGWAVLAGWLSSAQQPTRDEVLSFFGPDTD